MSPLLLLLGALQAVADGARWVVHNGAWCAAAAVALGATWVAWKLPAEDPPPHVTAADDAATPSTRLSDDQITAALDRFDWDAAKADLYDEPAEPNP